MKGKILIVDDEKNIRDSLSHFLSQIGHEVTTAGDYDDSLDIASKQKFDLIILDILLGDRTGIDFLREFNNGNHICPVIMITGAPDMDSATNALRLGAYDYIQKPVTKDKLLHVANQALTYKFLKDEQEKYRMHCESVFRNMKEGIVTVDGQSNIIKINDAAKKICSLFHDGVENISRSASFPCTKKCIEILRQTIAEHIPFKVYGYECHFFGPPGTVMNLTTSPLFNSSGKFTGAALLISDESRVVNLERNLNKRRQFHDMIGKSKHMQKIYAVVERLADVNSTVLITGESGTGKELIAEALHCSGHRRHKPLVKVNCSALQENLLESELFGHVRGAFTGAIENKMGRFHLADGGSIFLDEIGDLSKQVQIKLLRVLQEKEFERVGDSTPIKVNARLITATNQDLRKKVRSGQFREDLYYRLKVMEIHVPGLRERRDDIPLLVKHFLKKFNVSFNKEVNDISSDVMRLFMDYSWPGNVRELENTMEHSMVYCCNSIVAVDHLPDDFRESVGTREQIMHSKIKHDMQTVIHALKKTGWNKSRAACLLGISRPTLYSKMKEIEKYYHDNRS